MAYNVFKRPMFRKGGTPAQGTGIMSHVEPRVKAATGFPNFGTSQVPINPETGMTAYETMLGNRPDPRRAAPQRIPYIKSGGFNFMTPTPAATTSTGPNTKQGLLSLSSNRAPVREIPYIKGAGFGFMKPGGRQSQLVESSVPSSDEDGYDEFTGMFSGVDDGTRFVTQDDGTIIDTKSGNIVTKEQITTILKKEKGPASKEPPTIDLETGESDMKKAITDEVGILEDLLKDTGMSRAEKALLLAKAIGTPGSIKDKADVAGKEALKYKKEERKQKKGLILTAYKNYKAKDLAGDKMNREETLVKNLVNRQLKDPKNTKSKSQLELEAWKSLAPGDRNKDVNKEFALIKLADRGFISQIQDARRDIKNYGKKNDTASKAKVVEAQRILDLAAKYAAAAGVTVPVYAEGGRVERASGSPMTGETVTESVVEKTPNATMEATEVVAADNIEPMAPVTKMDFADLRNRLPQEITDDIVQLLANSEEALQAFAYIKTQGDINAFNIKYGVNLILPAENV